MRPQRVASSAAWNGVVVTAAEQIVQLERVADDKAKKKALPTPPSPISPSHFPPPACSLAPLPSSLPLYLPLSLPLSSLLLAPPLAWRARFAVGPQIGA